MQPILPTLTRWLAALVGIFWCYIEPTVPFILICAFAVLIDCITAWRLNRRIRKAYTKQIADGKLKSSHMSKMISDLAIVFLCIVLAEKVDTILLAHWGGVHLANYAAAVFCLTQIVSILENESSCNGSSWAIIAQKILADKTARHLEIDITEFDRLKKQQQRKDKAPATAPGDSAAENATPPPAGSVPPQPPY